MENPSFFEAFQLAFELLIKWIFLSAVLLFLGQVALFLIYFWKSASSLSGK